MRKRALAADGLSLLQGQGEDEWEKREVGEEGGVTAEGRGLVVAGIIIIITITTTNTNIIIIITTIIIIIIIIIIVIVIIIIIVTIIITIITIIIIIIIIILLCTNMQRSLCSSDTRAVITQFEVCK